MQARSSTLFLICAQGPPPSDPSSPCPTLHRGHMSIYRCSSCASVCHLLPQSGARGRSAEKTATQGVLLDVWRCFGARPRTRPALLAVAGPDGRRPIEPLARQWGTGGGRSAHFLTTRQRIFGRAPEPKVVPRRTSGPASGFNVLPRMRSEPRRFAKSSKCSTQVCFGTTKSSHRSRRIWAGRGARSDVLTRFRRRPLAQIISHGELPNGSPALPHHGDIRRRAMAASVSKTGSH